MTGHIVKILTAVIMTDFTIHFSKEKYLSMILSSEGCDMTVFQTVQCSNRIICVQFSTDQILITTVPARNSFVTNTLNKFCTRFSTLKWYTFFVKKFIVVVDLINNFQNFQSRTKKWKNQIARHPLPFVQKIIPNLCFTSIYLSDRQDIQVFLNLVLRTQKCDKKMCLDTANSKICFQSRSHVQSTKIVSSYKLSQYTFKFDYFS